MVLFCLEVWGRKDVKSLQLFHNFNTAANHD